MPEYLRIRDPESGAEYTYDTAKVEALGLADHVIDKDPLGPDGLPAPAKPRMPLGEPLPGSTSDRRRAAKKAESSTDRPQGYAAMKAAELKAAIKSRNVGREDGIQLSTSGNKAALVAVLEADDEASKNPADDEDSNESDKSAAAPTAPETPSADSTGKDAGQPSASHEGDN